MATEHTPLAHAEIAKGPAHHPPQRRWCACSCTLLAVSVTYAAGFLSFYQAGITTSKPTVSPAFYLACSVGMLLLLLVSIPLAYISHTRQMPFTPLPERGQREHLHNLEGLRSIGAIWILCDHMTNYYPQVFCSQVPDASPLPFLHLGWAGVYIFILMSGFLTEHVNASTRLCGGSLSELCRWYMRRCERVVISTWLSMAATVALDTWAYYPKGFFTFGGHGYVVLPCALFLPNWIADDRCPNPSTWTVGVMLTCWLFYPLMQLLVRAVEVHGRARGLLTLGAACIIFGHLPFALLTRGEDEVNVPGSSRFRWYAPPMWFGTFVVGSVAAALTRLRTRQRGSAELAAAGDYPIPQDSSPRWHGMVSDCAAVAFVLCVYHQYANSRFLLEHFGPFVVYIASQVLTIVAAATFISFSSSPHSLCGRLVSHPALVSLGGYSLSVYLWQEPIFRLLLALLGCNFFRYTSGTLLLIGIVYVFAGCFTVYVELPLIRKLRAATGTATERPV